jgi:hypothetical protein
VQDVDYGKLKEKLLHDPQILGWIYPGSIAGSCQVLARCLGEKMHAE